MKTPTQTQVKQIKRLLFFVCLIPLIRLFWLGYQDDLGANPVEFIEHSTGYWALFILLATLSLTPIRLVTKTAWVMQLRRMLGLFMFFYACVHLVIYIVLDYSLLWDEIYLDIIDHPYIIVGLLAFVLSIPLAVTSTNKMIKRLGKKWKTLHKSVYLVAVLGVVHFWWLVKKDIREPLLFAAVLALLFLVRWFYNRQTQTKSVVRTA